MPHTLDQAHQLLEKAHASGRLAHAFLVSGARGSGKEEFVCRVSQMLNGSRGENLSASESDLLRVVRPIGKTRKVRVDDMRNLERELHGKIDIGRWKIGVVVDADRMNPESENAFLKTLEEPPPESILFLLTERPNQLLPTIHSRCVNIELMAAPGQKMAGPQDQVLLDLIREMFADGLGDESLALTLQGRLKSIFDDLKDDFEKQASIKFAEEERRYGKTTESGNWLKERKNFLESKAAGNYLTTRSQMIKLLVAWFGDALRIKGGADYIEVAELEAVSRLIAENESMPSLLRRMSALETMAHELEFTNAAEALVMEVGCLRAFVA